MSDFQQHYDDELPPEYWQQEEFDLEGEYWEADVVDEAKWLLNSANEVDVRAILGHDWADRLDMFLSENEG